MVSVGADGGALVWDPNLGKKANKPTVPHNLPHPVGVRSVAAAPPAAKAMLVVTGADDGKVRVWDVTNRDKLPTAPKVVPDDAHTSAVQAVAISPDGKFFATAAGRDVFVWELASAKKLYALPVEHRDAVTAVSFTPQNTLVTTSKDGSVKVWKLGTERAAVVRTLDHRAGAVDVLGRQPRRRARPVRPGQGPARPGGPGHRADGRPTAERQLGRVVRDAGPVRPAGHAVRRGGRRAAAVRGGDGGRRRRPEGRPSSTGTRRAPGAAGPRWPGSSRRAGRRSPPPRAARSAGSSSWWSARPPAAVHLWKPPTEARKTRTGRITLVDHTDARYVTVRVEMDNKELGLIDHSAATIIVPPAN